jgi:hypothetical protein
MKEPRLTSKVRGKKIFWILRVMSCYDGVTFLSDRSVELSRNACDVGFVEEASLYTSKVCLGLSGLGVQLKAFGALASYISY